MDSRWRAGKIILCKLALACFVHVGVGLNLVATHEKSVHLSSRGRDPIAGVENLTVRSPPQLEVSEPPFDLFGERPLSYGVFAPVNLNVGKLDGPSRGECKFRPRRLWWGWLAFMIIWIVAALIVWAVFELPGSWRNAVSRNLCICGMKRGTFRFMDAIPKDEDVSAPGAVAGVAAMKPGERSEAGTPGEQMVSKSSSLTADPFKASKPLAARDAPKQHVGARGDRDPCWDRVRFHLMTAIIWSHWVGKWGLADTKAGWFVLNFLFTFHVVGFIFLSGCFSLRASERIASARTFTDRTREITRVFRQCADLLLVYVMFSWLRGWITEYMTKSEVNYASVIRCTFLFYQGPWYLAALILWRVFAPILHSLGPLMFPVAFAAGALCPYPHLAHVRDPFAIREALHYLPFFVMGLSCGPQTLEKLVYGYGVLTPLYGLAVLLVVAVVILFPVGDTLFEDQSLRWVIVGKTMPPLHAGGAWLMLLLYAVKMVCTTAAFTVLAAPCPFPQVNAAIESAGRRSMTVYVVHMVAIMVPGEGLCLHMFLRSRHVVPLLIALWFGALITNLLCGSLLTAKVLRPLTEPLDSLCSLLQGVPVGKQRDEGAKGKSP